MQSVGNIKRATPDFTTEVVNDVSVVILPSAHREAVAGFTGYFFIREKVWSRNRELGVFRKIVGWKRNGYFEV